MGRKIGIAGGVIAAVVALPAGFNALMRLRRRPLPPPFDAESGWLATTAGGMRSYERGEGPALLMLHSFNAAGTAYELRPLFERLAAGRRVIAVDWLGFGLSERPHLLYTADLYQRLLAEVLDAIAPDPVDVLALSLPGQYAAIEAAARPGRIRRLMLISPTGFGGRFGGRPGRLSHIIARLLRLPLLGQAFYNALTLRVTLRAYLRSIYAEPSRLHPEYVDYSFAACRQPGARFAPASFIAGLLNAAGARSAYERMTTPTLLLFGDHPRFTDPAPAQRMAAANPGLIVKTVRDAGDLPHKERPDQVLDAIEEFMCSPAGNRP